MGYFTELFIQIITIVTLFILPIILVLTSNRVETTGKAMWSIAVLFFSWIAYVVFLIATKKPSQQLTD